MQNGTNEREFKMGFWWMLCAALITALSLAWSGTARAESGGDPAPGTAPSAGAEEGAPQGLPAGWEQGPKHVALGHELSLELPGNYAFLPPALGAKLLEKNGSFHNEDLLGLIASTDPNEDWFVVARFEESGFIKDDEKLDADEILEALRDGAKEANEERQQKGFKPLNVDGWSEPPRYEPAQHHMVWALIVSDADGKSVNLNTRILGRKGYVSLNLVTDPQKLATYRGHATTLLAATHFDSGARYADFNEKTDKVAEYGLAGLVLAGAGLGAAKLVKLGLLAKFSKVIIGLLIAGKKFVVIALVAIGAFLKKVFSARKDATAGGDPAA